MKAQRTLIMEILKFLLIFSILLYKTESITLNCRFYEPFEDFDYCCYVEKYFSTSRDNREISEVIGEHMNGKNHDRVEIIDIYEKETIFFPRGISKFFKNLQTVSILNSKLQRITKNDLKEFGDKLIKLKLAGNQLKVIEADLFEFNKNLEEIYLQRNQIIHIDLRTFDKLEKLKWLHIGENLCWTARDGNGYGRDFIRGQIQKLEDQCKDELYMESGNKINQIIFMVLILIFFILIFVTVFLKIKKRT